MGLPCSAAQRGSGLALHTGDQGGSRREQLTPSRPYLTHVARHPHGHRWLLAEYEPRGGGPGTAVSGGPPCPDHHTSGRSPPPPRCGEGSPDGHRGPRTGGLVGEFVVMSSTGVW